VRTPVPGAVVQIDLTAESPPQQKRPSVKRQKKKKESPDEDEEAVLTRKHAHTADSDDEGFARKRPAHTKKAKKKGIDSTDEEDAGTAAGPRAVLPLFGGLPGFAGLGSTLRDKEVLY